MIKRLALWCVLAACAASLAATQAFHFKLPAQCQLPFASIAPDADAFESCDNTGHISGHTAPTKAKTLDSRAKNNFCADASTVVPMHFEDFSRLEMEPIPRP